MLTLTVTLSDSAGDGWNSNVLAIKQNNSIIGTFGELFTSGSANGPITINVLGDLNAYIVVTQLGTKTDEVGFIITAPNGTIVHQRNSGSPFSTNIIFSTFCPIGRCPNPNSVILNITMSDSIGDGWQGIIIAIKQNNTIIGTFGSAFTWGYTSGPVYITINGSLDTLIVVNQTAANTNQVGFVVRGPGGNIIF